MVLGISAAAGCEWHARPNSANLCYGIGGKFCADWPAWLHLLPILHMWLYLLGQTFRSTAEALHLPSLKGVKRDFYLYFTGAFFIFMAGSIIYTPFPVYLSRELKIANEAIFLLYILNSFASALAYLRIGALSDKLGHKRMLTLALLIRGIAFFSYIFLPFLLGVGLLYIISGLTWSVLAISGSVVVAMLASGENEGEAMGAYNAVIGISAIVGSLVGGLIVFHLNYNACFIAGAIATFLGAFIIKYLQSDFKLRL